MPPAALAFVAVLAGSSLDITFARVAPRVMQLEQVDPWAGTHIAIEHAPKRTIDPSDPWGGIASAAEESGFEVDRRDPWSLDL